MSIRRYRSLAVLVLALALPATTQAQFGSLIKKAKALRTNVDSAKAVVDTTRTVVTATKSAAADVMTGTTGPATPPDSSGGSGKSDGAGGHSGMKAGAAGTAASGGSAAATAAPTATPTTGVVAGPRRRAGTTAAPATTRTSATKSAPATSATSTASPPAPAERAVTPAPKVASTATRTATPAASTRGGVALMTDAEFGQFAQGFAAEQARLKTNAGDMAGALAAGEAASGLSKVDYITVRQKVMMYAPYAKANKTDQIGRLFSAQDLTVLNAHKSEIIQMVPR
jgi:DNA-binding protein HU-beta